MDNFLFRGLVLGSVRAEALLLFFLCSNFYSLLLAGNNKTLATASRSTNFVFKFTFNLLMQNSFLIGAKNQYLLFLLSDWTISMPRTI